MYYEYETVSSFIKGNYSIKEVALVLESREPIKNNYIKKMDFKAIDRHLQSCMDKGIAAQQAGLTKYDNDYEPGSLSFDAWASGFTMAEDRLQPIDLKEDGV